MSFSLPGLASGLNTAEIISQLMKIERLPYQKLEQKKTTINSEVSIFRNINTKLSALRTAAEDLLLSSNFNLRSATNSDETVVRATVSEGVPESSYDISVKQLATKHSVKSMELTQADLEQTVSDWLSDHGLTSFAISLTIGEDSETFEVEHTPEMTVEEALHSLVSKINDSDLAVDAALLNTNQSTGAKTLVLNSRQFGTLGSMDFAGTDSELIGLLGLDDAITAQDSWIVLNGVDIRSSTNELDEVIPGLGLTLLKAGESATISVTKDADKIAEKVESFVKAYNDVINTIRTNTSKGRGLQGDSTLRSLDSHLTSIFNRQVGGDSTLEYLFEIGLEIDKGITDGSLMTGTISFDKSKFKEALAEDPSGVFQLFAYDGDGDEDGHGIAQLFKDLLPDWTRSGSGIITSKIDGYSTEISFLNKQMEDMENRLLMKENHLKRQFTAMESALIQLQNQQSWMASQIASMGIYTNR